MERESNQMQTLCRSGCGFYGSPATDGLCSLCYKEALKKKQQLPTSTPSSHCAALTTGSTTTNHLNLTTSGHTTTNFDVANSMSRSHLPSKSASRDLKNVASSNQQPEDNEKDRGSRHSQTGVSPRTSISAPSCLPAEEVVLKEITVNDSDAHSDNVAASDVSSPSSLPGDLHKIAPKDETSPTTPATGVRRRWSTSMDQAIVQAAAVAADQEAVATAVAAVAVAADDASSPVTSATAESDTSNEDKDGDKDAKKKKNRCAVCRKKVGLTGFQCRCGGLFCAIHRYSDKHDCSFNYREMGAQEIRRNNPVVVGEKIQKI